MRRVAPGVYELSGNADVTVSLAGGTEQQVTAEQFVQNGGRVRLTGK